MDHDLTGVLHHPSITFSPAHLKSLMKQLLEGLGFIHRRGVLHRDLKGSNILLGKNGELKIADFGLARFYAIGRNNDYTNRVITQWYKPPELLFGTTIYGAEVDMWGAGYVLSRYPSCFSLLQANGTCRVLDASSWNFLREGQSFKAKTRFINSTSFSKRREHQPSNPGLVYLISLGTSS